MADAPPQVFLSYSHSDSEIATELAARIHDAGIECFVAERDITATQQWEPRLRDAIREAKCVLILLTPRSRTSTWVAIETGAAWVLDRNLVPATMFVEIDEMPEPIRRFQARKVETSAQITTLVQELQRILGATSAGSPQVPPDLRKAVGRSKESFTEPGDWQRLQRIGTWDMDERSRILGGSGEHQYLLSHTTYGLPEIRISTRIRFSALRPHAAVGVNAGIVFGWKASGDVRRYFNLMFTGSRLLLELVGGSGGTVFRDFVHVDEGVPFRLEPGRWYEFDITIDHRKLFACVDRREIYSPEFQGEREGRVGLRPWRCTLESDRFDVEQV